MPLVPILSLLLLQAGSASALERDKLAACQGEARRDPATAIATANQWLREVADADRSAPQQCLGFAYVSLLRWQAAEQAFMASREALPLSEFAARARLAAMAGNAALAEGRNEAARTAFDAAQADAAGAGEPELAGEIAADRARALVGLGLLDQAGAALATARHDAPQRVDSWLLSATLSRRQGNLAQAQAEIATAAALAPESAAVGLEAGLIAALAGKDEAAHKSWQSVIALAPSSDEAAVARGYLAQLDSTPAAR